MGRGGGFWIFLRILSIFIGVGVQEYPYVGVA